MPRLRTNAVGALLVACIAAAAPSFARARDLWESSDGEYTLTLRTSLKGSWLLSFPQEDALLDTETSGAALFRLRLELGANVGEYVSAQVAYEHRTLGTTAPGTGAGLLPPTTLAPFRLVPLDAPIIDQATYSHRHELDRAFLSLHSPYAELTLGRQAIGLGRGAIFSAIDVFSPFSPLEVDREWRRGVDAVHAELRAPSIDWLSADWIAAFGPLDNGALASWAMLGRVRAILGDVDAELIGGKRGEDLMAGTAVSATIADSEIHGEFALFATDGEGVDRARTSGTTLVHKGLVGGSHMFDVWRGLRLLFEYHYSGFGVRDLHDAPEILFDPEFQARLLRGDTQTLGRHALALMASTDVHETVFLSLNILQSPTDHSGTAAPAVVWSQSDQVSLSFTLVVPWGAGPEGGVPRSDFGSSPFTFFVQARIYD